MFTGLVEEMGTVSVAGGTRLRIDAALVLEDAAIGASIAVNGCCLTVVALGEGTGGPWWEAEVTGETLARTNLGALAEGDAVNLERPVRLADRLGGHLVQGHVDAVGEVVRPAPDLAVRVPSGLERYLVEKGSVAVDGVSLTVVDAPGPPGPDPRAPFTVAVIPHTAEATTLGRRRPGDVVNIEVDVMAKYAERLLGEWAPAPGRMDP